MTITWPASLPRGLARLRARRRSGNSRGGWACPEPRYRLARAARLAPRWHRGDEKGRLRWRDPENWFGV